MAQKTLAELMAEVGRQLGDSWSGVATGGSTTTLVDTVFLQQRDDYWGGLGENMGTLYVWRTTDNLAPEGEAVPVTDFDNATNTVTCGTLTAAIDAGDRYTLITPLYPYYQIVDAINEGVRRVGMQVIWDESSITTASNTLEYDLPAAGIDVRRVLIPAGYTKVAGTGTQWRPLENWYIEKTAAGSVDKLVFEQQPPSGYSVAIVYLDDHADLVDASDTLDESYPWRQVALNAAIYLLSRRAMELQGTDSGLNGRMQLLGEQLQREMLDEPYILPHRQKMRTIVEQRRRRYATDTYTP